MADGAGLLEGHQDVGEQERNALMWDWAIGGLLIVGSIVVLVCIAAAWALGAGGHRRGRDR